MENSQQKMNKVRDEIDYDRKPMSFEDVTAVAPAKHAELIHSLPRHTMETLGIKKLSDDFKADNVPQHFVLDHPHHGKHLVNTEGYNYARYVAKVPKMEHTDKVESAGTGHRANRQMRAS